MVNSNCRGNHWKTLISSNPSYDYLKSRKRDNYEINLAVEKWS
jgi:hypothetical protein